MSIRKIGEKLRDGKKLTKEQEIEFDTFRENHATIIKLFTKELEQIDFQEKPLIAGRTKRIETIISKLRRPQHPKLNSIHDIAGSRLIFGNLKFLNDAMELLDQDIIQNFKEIIDKKKGKDKYNYIKNPKEDGYRGVHRIFSYTGENISGVERNVELKGLKIELQLRTHLQHIWATTVETYDMFKKTCLKTMGMKKMETNPGKFFKCCSLIFAGIENNDSVAIKENIERIYQHDDFKIILNELQGMEGIKNIKLPDISAKSDSEKENQEFILITNLKKKETTFFMLPSYNSEERTQEDISDEEIQNNSLLINSIYRKIEQRSNESVVLLLDLKNVKNLQVTYPNYFLNTKEFIEILEKFKKIYIEGGD